MTSSDARNLAFELWKLRRTGKRFRDLRRRYDIARSPRDDTVAASSHRARRHQRAVRLGGTLNRARIALGDRIRICRQRMNGLAAGPHAGEPWRTDARRRLAPALTDLTDAIQRTLEVHPESGAGPTHAEILGALDRHETDIRECGQFLSDVAAEVREAAVANALHRYPTLLDALIYLGRRNDIRSTTYTEREGGKEHRSHVAGEPIGFALTWVHSRCTWQSRRNGVELWDYVGQSSRGGIVDAEVREAVVPQLRALDTPDTRRAFWSELLSRFPHIAVALGGDAPAMPARHVEPKPKAITTTWRDVQRRLLALYDRGDAYSSIGDLTKRLGCARATIQKAFKDSAKLKGWQVRHSAKGTPRASRLTEIVMDKVEQTREPDPAQEAETDDVDTVFARLIQEAKPDERAELKKLTADQRRQMVELLRNDPDKFDRVLDRKA